MTPFLAFCLVHIVEYVDSKKADIRLSILAQLKKVAALKELPQHVISVQFHPNSSLLVKLLLRPAKTKKKSTKSKCETIAMQLLTAACTARIVIVGARRIAHAEGSRDVTSCHEELVYGVLEQVDLLGIF